MNRFLLKRFGLCVNDGRYVLGLYRVVMTMINLMAP